MLATLAMPVGLLLLVDPSLLADGSGPGLQVVFSVELNDEVLDTRVALPEDLASE